MTRLQIINGHIREMGLYWQEERFLAGTPQGWRQLISKYTQIYL